MTLNLEEGGFALLNLGEDVFSPLNLKEDVLNSKEEDVDSIRQMI